MRNGARPTLGVALTLVIALGPTPLTRTRSSPAIGGNDDGPPRLLQLPKADPASRSLSPAGRRLVEARALDGAPRYSLSATVNPKIGAVDGLMRVSVPRSDQRALHFRVLAGLPELRTGVRVSGARVDGRSQKPSIDRALLTLPVPPARRKGHGRIDVQLRWTYRLPDLEASAPGAQETTAATIGLLGRHGDDLNLGHWFPIWIPPGAATDADLRRVVDVANFAASVIVARVRVPQDVQLVSGGVTVGRVTGHGLTTYTEEGVGLRDLSLSVGRGRVSNEVKHGDVTVRAFGPIGEDVAHLAGVGAASLDAYDAAFAPYPWSELDLAVVPLGGGVGGIEWPGTAWLQSSTDDGTIAHEVAHQWWHALVGNDSIRAPVVDEPLAEFSTCLALGRIDGAGAEQRCDDELVDRGISIDRQADARADQPTTAFTSIGQYFGIVYGKAPAFYADLERKLGRDATLAALHVFATRYAFKIATPSDLRASLQGAVPGRANEIRVLWERWME